MPDSDGDWWRDITGSGYIRPVCVARAAPDSLWWSWHTAGQHWDGPVTDDGRWLGPVAPPGSVAPEEHARAVREAHRDGRDADLRDTDAEAWGCSRVRSDLIARLTASGLDGEAIVRGIET